MSDFTEHQRSLAILAADLIARAGGRVTYDEYDRLMAPVVYFAPIHWIAGWGLSRHQRKENTDRFCVFAAVKLGMVTAVNGGYTVDPRNMAW